MNIKAMLFILFFLIGCAHKGEQNWATRSRKMEINEEKRKRVSREHNDSFVYFIPLYFKRID